jgi:hypothetical protein
MPKDRKRKQETRALQAKMGGSYMAAHNSQHRFELILRTVIHLAEQKQEEAERQKSVVAGPWERVLLPRPCSAALYKFVGSLDAADVVKLTALMLFGRECTHPEWSEPDLDLEGWHQYVLRQNPKGDPSLGYLLGKPLDKFLPAALTRVRETGFDLEAFKTTQPLPRNR